MIKINDLPSLEYLEECFELDSTCPSGIRWKVRPRHHYYNDYGCKMGNSQWAGKPAGNSFKGHYFTVGINKISYATHRIVFALYNRTTDFKNKVIDHIDRNKINNHPENLRAVEQHINCQNSKLSKANKTGVKNVTQPKGSKLFYVSIRANGINYKYGSFKTLIEAAEVAKRAAEEHHGEFSSHSQVSSDNFCIANNRLLEILPSNHVYFRGYLLY